MDDDNTAIVTLEPSDLAEVTIPETPGAPEPRRKGRRTLPILAGVAVLSLAAGFGLSHLVVNPAEVAARTAPPQAGLITVPIEHRPLSNDVNIRGDVMFDGATNLVVETAEMATRPIVTGMIPEVGQELGAGDVALEVAGRPVILLPGGLPTYRSLRMGTSGPDVVQLREALDYLGFDAGDLDSDTFDADLAGAVAALYLSTGFDPPSPSEGASAHLDAATQRLSSARENLARANTDLTEADSGPDPVAVASADAQIRAAQDQYEIAQASQRDFDTTCADPANAADPMLCGEAARLQVQAQVNSARDGVHLAQVARNALNAAPDL
ncbi:MAG: hypothetical protein FWG11_04970, partial [Promicromonosporaceae bacterium]|nr:hypothetical protein [Promicromonosporaceae bacterium]